MPSTTYLDRLVKTALPLMRDVILITDIWITIVRGSFAFRGQFKRSFVENAEEAISCSRLIRKCPPNLNGVRLVGQYDVRVGVQQRRD